MTNTLTDAELASFRTDGFLVCRGILDDEGDLAPVRRAFARVVDEQARDWHRQGLIDDLAENAPFERRYAALREQLPPKFSNHWRRVLVSREIHRLWSAPGLLGRARSLLGDEIYAHGTWNGRPRLPNVEAQTVAWHQDAYYYPDYEDTDGPFVTCWIPLLATTEDNGCLQVLPGSHHRRIDFEEAPDFQRRVPQAILEEELAAGAVPYSAELAPGDALLFDARTFHRSLTNVSDVVRWTLDIRYTTIETGLAKGGPGFIVHSATDPTAPEPYEAWAAKYAWVDNPRVTAMETTAAELAQVLDVPVSDLQEY